MSERENGNEVAMSALRAIAVRTSAVVYDLLLLIAVWFVVTAVLLTLNDGQAIESPLYALAMIVLGWP